MNLLLNGTLMTEPGTLTSEWFMEDGAILRRLTLEWPSLGPIETKEIVSRCAAAGGVDVTFTDPLTNAPATLKLYLQTARAAAYIERGGVMTYEPVSVTLRQVPEP